MATRLYFTRQAAGFTPSNIRAAFDEDDSIAVFLLSPTKGHGTNPTWDDILAAALQEFSSTNPWRVLGLRHVSDVLPSAKTIDGTVNLCVGVAASPSSSPVITWGVHLYVTVGDTDAVRGTLLDNYSEAGGVNDWPTTSAARELVAAQTLTPVAAQAGDRIVTELLGYFRNTTGLSRTGNLRHGTTLAGTDGTPVEDLTGSGDTNTTTRAGWIEFSADLFQATQVKGSAVLGVNTTVTATRAIAMGLDGNMNTLSESGKCKVFGNFEVTGTSQFSGTTTLLNPASVLSAIVSTDTGAPVIDSNGNVVYVNG